MHPHSSLTRLGAYLHRFTRLSGLRSLIVTLIPLPHFLRNPTDTRRILVALSSRFDPGKHVSSRAHPVSIVPSLVAGPPRRVSSGERSRPLLRARSIRSVFERRSARRISILSPLKSGQRRGTPLCCWSRPRSFIITGSLSPPPRHHLSVERRCGGAHLMVWWDN